MSDINNKDMSDILLVSMDYFFNLLMRLDLAKEIRLSHYSRLKFKYQPKEIHVSHRHILTITTFNEENL